MKKNIFRGLALLLICFAVIPAEAVDKHVEKTAITDLIVTPAHGERDHAAFDRSVRRLKADGCRDELEV